MELQRPPGKRLGVELALVTTQRSAHLAVESISDGGIVQSWNRKQSHDPDRIKAGDVFLRVNGIEDLTTLANELRTAEKLEVQVQRGMGDEGHPALWQRGLPQPGAPPYPAVSGMTMPGQGPQHMPPHVGLPPQPGAMQQNRSQQQQAALRQQHNQQMHPGHQMVHGQSQMQGSRMGPHGGPPGSMPGAPQVQGRGGPCGSAPPPPPPQGMDSSIYAMVPSGGQRQRPSDQQFVFEAVLSKPDGTRLGIDVLPVTISNFGGLSVLNVARGGVVDTWNQEQTKAQLCIRSGDTLMSVNETRGDVAKMMEELRVKKDLRLLVLRRPQPSMSGQAPGVTPLGAVAMGPGSAPAGVPGGSAVAGLCSGPGTGPSGPWGGTLPQHAQHAQLHGSKETEAIREQRERAERLAKRKQNREEQQQLAAAAAASAAAAAAAAASGMSTGLAAPPGIKAVGGMPVPRGMGLTMAGAPPPDVPLTGLANHQTGSSLLPPPGVAPSAPPAQTLSEQGQAQVPQLRFEVVLDRTPGVSLGLDVVLVRGGAAPTGLVVEGVAEGGPVDQWNKRSKPPRRVQPGDHILEVNDVAAWHPPARRAQEFARDTHQVRFMVQRKLHGVGSGSLPPPGDNALPGERPGANVNPTETSGGVSVVELRSPPAPPSIAAPEQKVESGGPAKLQDDSLEANVPMPAALWSGELGGQDVATNPANQEEPPALMASPPEEAPAAPPADEPLGEAPEVAAPTPKPKAPPPPWPPQPPPQPPGDPAGGEEQEEPPEPPPRPTLSDGPPQEAPPPPPPAPPPLPPPLAEAAQEEAAAASDIPMMPTSPPPSAPPPEPPVPQMPSPPLDPQVPQHAMPPGPPPKPESRGKPLSLPPPPEGIAPSPSAEDEANPGESLEGSGQST